MIPHSHMSARLLDGNAVAKSIRESLTSGIQAFTTRERRAPSLGIALVGDDPASHIYVRNKVKSGADVGFEVRLEEVPAASSLATVLELVSRWNADPTLDGILVQSPLPSSMGSGAARQVFDLIDPSKDVDGFSPINVGRLVQNRPALVACTPAGIIELLDRSGIVIAGQRAVIIGRSDIVGKPMSLLLLHRDATVTICHSKTPDLPSAARSADILVAAIGRAGFVTRDFVKPGATVIDVGMNRVTDERVAATLFREGSPKRADFERKGSVLVGDVHPDVNEVAGAITPVPGGVGPLTIAMLMSNTLKAAEARSVSHVKRNPEPVGEPQAKPPV